MTSFPEQPKSDRKSSTRQTKSSTVDVLLVPSNFNPHLSTRLEGSDELLLYKGVA